jgi:hypothetical protein
MIGVVRDVRTQETRPESHLPQGEGSLNASPDGPQPVSHPLDGNTAVILRVAGQDQPPALRAARISERWIIARPLTFPLGMVNDAGG